MKVLLTGKPGSGKTTLLEKFIEAVPHKQGFVAHEVRDNSGRQGFELVSSTGQLATLASVDSESKIRVSRYGVELGQLDNFLTQLPLVAPGSLLYIDEIGQMELFSDRFKEFVATYLEADNPYIGTITSVFQDDFTDSILQRDDIILLNIDQGNREQIGEVLDGLVPNIVLFQKLTPAAQKQVNEMARSYIQSTRFIQLKKLFKNAIKYLAEHRINQINDTTFQIEGNTNEHTTIHQGEQWICDCDLFRGAGQFKNKAGECSHIQAGKLFLAH